MAKKPAKKAADKSAEKNNGLAQRPSGLLSKQQSMKTVGALELALLEAFPREDAEAWDRTGLLVGDPAKLVQGVAVALDPTVEAIYEASALGANVLLTHHPAYLEAIDSFRPGSSVAADPGAGVWAAIEKGVALICLHTALDVSVEASHALPGMLSLQYKDVVDPLEGSKKKGYGQLCSVKASESPLSLGQLAARCTAVFGRQPRVWGDFGKHLSKVATCTGAAGDLPQKCLGKSVDCLVCGEIRYHDALSASQAGLAIIEIGHDTSELPLAAILVATLKAIGVPNEKITVLDQKNNWAYPEATRV